MTQTPPPRLNAAERVGPRVRFAWTDGFQAEFAAAWLLDNAEPAEGRIGGHRARTAQSLALAGPLVGVSVDADAARLMFAGESVVWSDQRLRACAESKPAPTSASVPWGEGAALVARPTIPYALYMADDGMLAAALAEVAAFGLVRLSGAGLDREASARAVGRFGFVRETNYGRLFEVRVVADPRHLADTGRALEPHTDNPYREPAPTLQLLHCIRNAGAGGATFFLDGFALAQDLRDAHPEDFARLASHAVPFAYVTASGERYEARSPVIRLTVDGQLSGIRFNHRALGAVDLGAAETAAWYEAYLRFAAMAEEPRRRLSLSMAPGDVALFDNERIVHGRDAFSGASERLLTGCYADRDALLATLARLRDKVPTAA
jgi:gamma-butyrobetaine dioxygenase